MTFIELSDFRMLSRPVIFPRCNVPEADYKLPHKAR